MATNLERQQQQLNKLSAELGNLKKQQSIAEQQSKGGLLKKPDPKSTEGKKLLAKFTEASRLVNAKQAEYNALEKTINDAKAKSKIVSDVGSDEEALKAAKAGLSVEEYRIKTQGDLKKSQDEQNKAAGIVVPIDTGNVPLEDFIKNEEESLVARELVNFIILLGKDIKNDKELVKNFMHSVR
jgi:leucyl aminopeptidase